jgi:hypothetical protein
MSTRLNAPETATALGLAPIAIDAEHRLRELRTANRHFNVAYRKVTALRKKLRDAEADLRTRKNALTMMLKDAANPVLPADEPGSGVVDSLP